MPPVRKVKPSQPPKLASEEKVVSGQLNKKIKKQEKIKQRKADKERGIVFIKHLPHGFFEEQMKNYFEQFGKVTRLRLARSKRTGGSKGYAFIEFEYPEVAQVAAETMDNYLMFTKLVKAAYIPPEKQRFNYFKTSLRSVKNKVGKQIYVSSKTVARQRKVKEYNDWSDEAFQKRTQSKLNKVKQLNSKYAHLGIDFSNVIVAPKKQQQVGGMKSSDYSPEEAVDGGNRKRKIKSEVGGKLQAKKGKSQVKLEDLLGDTINDDSKDEDWAFTLESDDAENEDEEFGSDSEDDEIASSDEETYGFSNDSDEEVDTASKQKSKQILKPTFSKALKPPKINRLEQLIKRKTSEGAIKKAKKPADKKVSITKAKQTAQVLAAKELLKTQPTIKNKSTKAKLTKKQKVKN